MVNRNSPKKDPPEAPPEGPEEVTVANVQCQDCDWSFEGLADDVGAEVWRHEENNSHEVNVVDERTEIV